LNIYENSFITSIDIKKGVAQCNNIKITADKIIVATHFPFINTHGSYFLKMYQHRSYVIALENAPNIDGMYLEEKMDGLSFRNYENLLLIGGGDHRTGKSGGNFAVLREFAKNAYPNAHEKFCWATQDCMTLDNVPYIGQYSKSTPNLYVATGFNKWGMTSSMSSAIILTDMVTGKKNEFEEVFSPHRSILKPQLAVNAFEAVANLLSFSKKRCPHLGCALKWNKVERTWDCPCHGSRFTESGKLIDNPATGDLNNV
ncbi:MAG: FAD-dependent oxidoreductase, partial [Bacillota bacterium]|nr:FAD-dependent oxidoreductase [Bacillota bacterium]